MMETFVYFTVDRTVRGKSMILRVHVLCFMEISLAHVYILQVAFCCRQRIIKSIYFLSVHNVVQNLRNTAFELYINPGGANRQHLFGLSGIKQIYRCTSAGPQLSVR